MRVSSNILGGSGDELAVIRGALGTISSAHPANSKIKKIKPIPIELRRPSILRASGHTFEYVGYGPVTTQQHYLNFKIDLYQKEKSF